MIQSMIESRLTFDQFIDLFIEIELPFHISPETCDVFILENKLLTFDILEEFLPFLVDDYSDIVEFVACMSFQMLNGIWVAVLWKADLLQHDYLLVTFSKTGTYIDHTRICGTDVVDGKVLQSAALVDEDYLIHVITGKNDVADGDMNYDASSSKVTYISVQDDGYISKA